jgi:hypothetical protein
MSHIKRTAGRRPVNFGAVDSPYDEHHVLKKKIR